MPPHGTIWGEKCVKRRDSVDAMASAFTNVANTVVSAISLPVTQREANSPAKCSTPHKEHSNAHKSVGISPRRRIGYHEKLFNQIDMLHKMYERGALTSQQFEKRREVLLSQMDSLSA